MLRPATTPVPCTELVKGSKEFCRGVLNRSTGLAATISAGRLNQPDTHGLTDSIDPIVHMELSVDVADMRVHRAFGDDELAGDLPRRQALGQQREDLALAAGQQVVDVRRRLGLVGVAVELVQQLARL